MLLVSYLNYLYIFFILCVAFISVQQPSNPYCGVNFVSPNNDQLKSVFHLN